MADHVAPRRSEGHRLPTHNFSSSAVGATKHLKFGVDFSSAPVPQRRYAADICDVTIRRNDLVIVFGQEAVFGDSVDSALQIRMNATASRNFVEMGAKLDDPLLQQIVAQEKLRAEPLTPLTEKPSQEAKVVANFVAVAIAGIETCMDFFHASAFSFRQLEKHGDLDVEPIVRVVLHTALFISLMDKFRQLSPLLSTGVLGETNELHAPV